MEKIKKLIKKYEIQLSRIETSEDLWENGYISGEREAIKRIITDMEKIVKTEKKRLIKNNG